MTYVDPNTCWDELNRCDRCGTSLPASDGAFCDPCRRATYGGGR